MRIVCSRKTQGEEGHGTLFSVILPFFVDCELVKAIIYSFVDGGKAIKCKANAGFSAELGRPNFLVSKKFCRSKIELKLK